MNNRLEAEKKQTWLHHMLCQFLTYDNKTVKGPHHSTDYIQNSYEFSGFSEASSKELASQFWRHSYLQDICDGWWWPYLTPFLSIVIWPFWIHWFVLMGTNTHEQPEPHISVALPARVLMTLFASLQTTGTQCSSTPQTGAPRVGVTCLLDHQQIFNPFPLKITLTILFICSFKRTIPAKLQESYSLNFFVVTSCDRCL